MSRPKRSFIAFCSVLTILVMVGLFRHTSDVPWERWLEFLILFGMLIYSQKRGVAVVNRITVSLSGAIHLTIIFVYGTGTAMLLVIAVNIIYGLLTKRELIKVYVNALQRTVTALLAGQLFLTLNSGLDLVMPNSLFPMLVTLFFYTGTNIVLVDILGSYLRNEPRFTLFKEMKINMWINLLIFGYVGVVFGFYVAEWEFFGILLLAGLLIGISEIMRHSMHLISKQERWIEAERELLLDAKTQTYNYRYLSEWLDQPENEDPFALLFIDIDDFKIYNDLYGHKSGDHALKTIAKMIMDSVRDQDRVVRFGGEEFVVILPNTDRTKAIQIAKRIQTKIADLSHARLEHIVTVSIGIAVYPEDSLDKMDLIHAADQAMYRAKADGKNQYRVVGEGG